ncbi:hypothetical protein ElyMa_000114000 [Elysia marginata]|uniref:Uncharacterized protein n=1 Tax=Elysia marginata TaxID=1093978 RepID=A0AAV4EMJ6_9GAST|nr:hypothetical protein ElyMa_000114000 [Elysia marginata]
MSGLKTTTVNMPRFNRMWRQQRKLMNQPHRLNCSQRLETAMMRYKSCNLPCRRRLNFLHELPLRQRLLKLTTHFPTPPEHSAAPEAPPKVPSEIASDQSEPLSPSKTSPPVPVPRRSAMQHSPSEWLS